MSSLPDDVWIRVLELGTETRRLDHRDLCNVAMVNSEFNQMSSHPSLWATLLSHDFPSSHYPSLWSPIKCHAILVYGPPSKSLYRNKFQEKQMAAAKARRSSRTNLYRSCRIIYLLNRLLREPFGPSELLFNIIHVYSHHFGETSLNIPNSTGPRNPMQECTTDQSTLRLEHEFKRSCNIGPKPKAIPNSRYYVPLNKPRRQAMPRKI